jgi:predicted GIY-YIG superfamily endonuclease
MSVKIYCIEDINDLKYVGSTTMLLRKRFALHKSNKDCSSDKLNLYNAIIYELETCDKENSKEREKYWIKELNAVNERKLDKRDKEVWRDYMRNYRMRLKLKK